MLLEQDRNNKNELFCLDISTKTQTQNRGMQHQELTPKSHFHNINQHRKFLYSHCKRSEQKTKHKHEEIRMLILLIYSHI